MDPCCHCTPLRQAPAQQPAGALAAGRQSGSSKTGTSGPAHHIYAPPKAALCSPDCVAGIMVHSLAHRIAAVIAYYVCRQDIGAAVALFLAWYGGDVVANPHAFIHYWTRKFELSGSVQANYRGRQRRMPDDVAKDCVIALLAGYFVTRIINGQPVEVQKYFRSVHDAVERNSWLKEQMDKYGITEGTLLRTLQHVAPGLRKRHLHPRKALSPENMAERAALCRSLLDKGDRALYKYLARTCWVDSKTFYIEPSGQMVWAPPGADMTVVDPIQIEIPVQPDICRQCAARGGAVFLALQGFLQTQLPATLYPLSRAKPAPMCMACRDFTNHFLLNGVGDIEQGALPVTTSGMHTNW